MSILDILEIYNQEEFNKIPEDFKGRIVIKFGTPYNKAIVDRSFRFTKVEAWDNSNVEVYGNSRVVARENSTVEAYENSTVVACGNSSIRAYGNSSVIAWDNSSIIAWDDSNVEARGYSSVIARGYSSVMARGHSSVIAFDNSRIVAWNNSSVEAWDNSSVEACENSSVVACENSTVEACGNARIVNMQETDKNLKISGNARIVYLPKNIKQYCDFYGIDHTKTKGTFYKAVHKNGNKYFSDYNNCFIYEIGKTYKQNCDIDTSKNCSYGLNIAFLRWALDFGKDWQDLAIIEVESKLSNIVVPKNSDGKIRTSKLKVIREVPLSECGIYGKIIENSLNKKE